MMVDQVLLESHMAKIIIRLLSLARTQFAFSISRYEEYLIFAAIKGAKFSILVGSSFRLYTLHAS